MPLGFIYFYFSSEQLEGGELGWWRWERQRSGVPRLLQFYPCYSVFVFVLKHFIKRGHLTTKRIGRTLSLN